MDLRESELTFTCETEVTLSQKRLCLIAESKSKKEGGKLEIKTVQAESGTLEIEDICIKEALAQTDGNISEAAKLLSTNRRRIQRRIQQWRQRNGYSY